MSALRGSDREMTARRDVVVSVTPVKVLKKNGRQRTRRSPEKRLICFVGNLSVFE